MDKNERVLTVAIIGAGSRGADSYGKIMNKDPRFKIVSVCDKRQVKLDAVKERFKISDDNLFLDLLLQSPQKDASGQQHTSVLC